MQVKNTEDRIEFLPNKEESNISDILECRSLLDQDWPSVKLLQHREQNLHKHNIHFVTERWIHKICKAGLHIVCWDINVNFKIFIINNSIE